MNAKVYRNQWRKNAKTFQKITIFLAKDKPIIMKKESHWIKKAKLRIKSQEKNRLIEKVQQIKTTQRKDISKAKYWRADQEIRIDPLINKVRVVNKKQNVPNWNQMRKVEQNNHLKRKIIPLKKRKSLKSKDFQEITFLKNSH